MTDTPEHNGTSHDLTRRTVLMAGGAGAVALGLGGALAVDASAEDGGTADTCYTLTSETVEGPYYIDANRIRQDVTEDQEGIPLVLRLKVIDAETCRPLKDAAVDIWHCNAVGVYSGYEASGSGGGGGGGPAPGGTPTGTPTGAPPSGGPGGPGGPGGHQEPTDDSRYLRGTWRTDRRGYVIFRTVFPGWYQGRCVHIHVKVHVDGAWTDAGYEGGRTCHTGQLFFAEQAVLLTEAVEPYSTNTAPRTTLDEDTIYPGNGSAGGLLHLAYDGRHIARGVRARLTLGVAPDATHDGG
ncbi:MULTISPECIES: intradiol ring-cleavage dioxygenase [Streptomyces]|uniref:intradiol ring-cleavage dioxygenase n=1 Tax=Streptomyces TaxID=1883 RepID=UPI00073DEAF1|nr:intradiol ring-cleavage dioxygenase [Streptomyces sp. EAS-AB2608]BCM67967.1 putative dioxygenase [Streptomyces sp. EAS-AB2608]CUW29193.1 Dioxygenase [Streptomyces reticuli]